MSTPVSNLEYFSNSCSTSASVSAWPALENAKSNPNENAHMKTDSDPGNEFVEWLNSRKGRLLEAIRVPTAAHEHSV
jgi:hypothetical protein